MMILQPIFLKNFTERGYISLQSFSGFPTHVCFVPLRANQKQTNACCIIVSEAQRCTAISDATVEIDFHQRQISRNNNDR